MSKRLIDRFERATGAGPVNFQFHASGHRFIGINAQAIDETSDPQIHLDAWQFIQSVGDSPFNGSNILLTHIPLHKPHGVCHDGPEAQRHIR
jgi:hypothetical protein